MGRDLTLFPENASKKDLRDYLEDLGFIRCKNFWDWPKGTLNYLWFDYEDFKSIDGVSADIYPISEEEKNITKNNWGLHVRNLYSASWYDVKMLNDVLRGARKKFGGTIHGDYGTNRYAPLWEDNSTPISRGITAVYKYVTQEIQAVKISLPNPFFSSLSSSTEITDDFIEYTKSLDPSRVIYNGLVPFAVSMFEYFFSQVFQILIANDEFALAKRNNFAQKIKFETLVEFHNKEKTIENIIAENYTFQNLKQLNKAYKDWLNIDIKNVLFKKRKIGNSVTYLENKISEIIENRHQIIHHFSIDRGLTKKDYIHILEAIEKSITEVVIFIENKYECKIIG